MVVLGGCFAYSGPFCLLLMFKEGPKWESGAEQLNGQ